MRLSVKQKTFSSISTDMDEQILALFVVTRDHSSGRKTAEFKTFLTGDRAGNSENIGMHEGNLDDNQYLAIRNV